MDPIECVVTCVNYADFLAHTLPYNKQHFDRMVVVTAPEDRATQRLCEFWHVQCVVTKEFLTAEGKFSKADGINAGLAKLAKTGWIVHLDADIVLPPLFRRLMETMDLDKSFLYGVDRFMVIGHEQWAQFMTRPTLQQENETWMHLGAFPLGVRVMHGHQFVPIGFTQVWHASSGILTYPTHGTDAGRTDMLFAEQWPRRKRGFIPEIVVYHLESELVQMGTNWKGRKTKEFVSPAPPIDCDLEGVILKR